MNFYITLLLRLISDILQREEFKLDPNWSKNNSSWSSSYVNRVLRNTYNLRNIKKFSRMLLKISKVFKLLEDTYSKKLLVELMSGRILGFNNVKLSLNTNKYWVNKKNLENLIKEDDYLSAKVSKLFFIDLKEIGIPIKLYMEKEVLFDVFILGHYRYNHNEIIDTEEGDIVIDAGACWGSSTFYFANKVNKSGQVHSFEFIPSNIHFLKKNLNLNPHLKDIIQIIEYPLWSTSNIELYYLDKHYASRIRMKPFKNSTKKIKTISIDDYVKRNSINRVDFIKMDIEGAEIEALIGAKKTITKFKPKLAISIYHKRKHYFEIPLFINSLNLNYKFYLDHFSLNFIETILFAKVE